MNKYLEAYGRIIDSSDLKIHVENGLPMNQDTKDVLLVQELVDKATPMRIIELDEDCSHFRCPSCKTEIYYADEYKHEHCLKCGQALDWSKDDYPHR